MSRAGRIGVKLAQLQRDAFAQVARADAGGFERLHRREHPLDLLGRGLDLGLQARADIFEVVFQVAVVGDGVGDDPRDGQIDGREFGEFELFDQLFLQRLTMLIAEVAAAVVVAGPGGVGRPAGLLAPSLVGDFDFGLFALIGGDGVAVEFGVLLLDHGHFFALAFAHGIRRGVQGEFVLGLEHDVRLEGLADMSLQVQRGQLQQADRLLQLRRHGELLADAKLQTWLQHSSLRPTPTLAYSLKSWPKYTSRTCGLARI